MVDAVRDRAAQHLVRHCRDMAAAGLVTAAAGNASVRLGSHALLTATGSRFAELTVDDLVLVDDAGLVVDGSARPTSEVDLHLQTYRLRPDVGAVMHTHGRHAVALSSVMDRVPALHYYSLDFGGAVTIAPYRTYGTRELAEVTTCSLGATAGVVMAHHGSLTVGPDLAVATARAELLEWLCEVALLAGAAGVPRELSPEALDDVRRRQLDRGGLGEGCG